MTIPWKSNAFSIRSTKWSLLKSTANVCPYLSCHTRVNTFQKCPTIYSKNILQRHKETCHGPLFLGWAKRVILRPCGVVPCGKVNKQMQFLFPNWIISPLIQLINFLPRAWLSSHLLHQAWIPIWATFWSTGGGFVDAYSKNWAH